jgi:hypothetical protein
MASDQCCGSGTFFPLDPEKVLNASQKYGHGEETSDFDKFYNFDVGHKILEGIKI